MTSSQEPPGQFQPNLVGNMLGEWGFRFVQLKGPCKEQNMEHFDKSSSHEPLARMHWYLAWSIIGERRL